MYAGVSARMCNMLQLHETSSSRDCSPVERENRKRVWWSTFCIDRMASTQMGVLPTLQIDQGDLSYPTNDGLACENMDEFSDPDYLTARIQLTIIQADAVNDHDNDNNDAKIDTFLHPTLRRLQAWKDGLPAHMAVAFHESMAKTEDNMALLRSLANLHLRHNHVCNLSKSGGLGLRWKRTPVTIKNILTSLQCVILLLRPLLLRQISYIVSNEESNEDSQVQQNDLQDLNQICLDTARSSLNMLIDLRTCGLLGGFFFLAHIQISQKNQTLFLTKQFHRCSTAGLHGKHASRFEPHNPPLGQGNQCSTSSKLPCRST